MKAWAVEWENDSGKWEFCVLIEEGIQGHAIFYDEGIAYIFMEKRCYRFDDTDDESRWRVREVTIK